MALLTAGFLAALALLAEPGAAAQTPQAPEYRVKAVFLFNFAQFVDWPPETFPDSQAPVVICILGDDPFGAVLDETVQGETLGGRPFEIRRYRRGDEIKRCHILFISQSESDRLEEVFSAIKNRPILTVGDGEGFSLRGGMVRFVTDKSRIRLRINLEAAQAAKLTISSKLLRSAEIVTSKARS
ncbi:MAG TPA: YfiR family protein [Gemmatimonadales bacterium]|nr:YfiR family protein [Gemmatimonadales bacterium]